MFFAGISIVVLSLCLAGIGMLVYLVGVTFKFSPTVLEGVGKITKGSFAFLFMGIVLIFIGGGNL